MSDKILNNIKAGQYDRKELENLYANAERLGRVEILTAAKQALKQLDERAYTKRFLKPIRDKIEALTTEIAADEGWLDWENNQVGNGVKVGGAMIRGEELAEYYVNYRHPSWKRSAYFVVFQHDEDSPVRYKIDPTLGEPVIVDTSAEAIRTFKEAIDVSG
jgi:hypothetical protein